MTLPTGTRLGPYEIVSLLGKGGMGEVYRAKDDRLGRDVAIKVLPPSFASDAERLKRFEQEARAAGQLNHPNVLAIHDIGVADKTPYIVSELLEGESLRELLASGPLPARRAAAYAIEVAKGLSAAHAKGIVHRDLKPENLQVLPGGHVKILDFGIAKLTRDSGGNADEAAQTLHSLTVTGAILGTASYMAPEQIRDQPTDQRTDIFALGAILYEMLAAQKAFPGATPADRMSAILNSEPPDLSRAVTDGFPGLEPIVRRCLGKRPEDRFDSARDLAFTLGLLMESGAGERRPASSADTAGRAARVATDLSFRRLTFREGDITEARFAPDGQTVIYSAAWEGRRQEIFVTRIDSPESHPLGLENAEVLSVGPTGDIAVQLRPRDIGGFITLGMLARLPLGGGVPRELLDGVYMADWGPDGKSLAVIREGEGVARLDYPIGRALFETPGWVSAPRVSRDGRRVAFLHHPTRGDNGGELMEVDLAGKARQLAGGFETVWGVAWSPDGESVWVSGTRTGGSPAIYSVGLDGADAPIHQSAGYVGVLDASRGGDALLLRMNARMRIEFRAGDAAEATDLSWLDWCLVRGLTPDGRLMLFDETGLGGGPGGSVYMRATDGSPAVRLGDGIATGFSPDGRWVVSANRADPTVMTLLPTGAGENVTLPTGGIRVHYAVWMPDGKSLCLAGNESGKRIRLYRYDLDRHEAVPFTEEGVGRTVADVSPDGRFVIAGGPSAGFALYPVAGGAPRPLEILDQSEKPIGWTADGSALWILQRGRIPASVFRLDLETGRRELWKEIAPRTRSGVDGLNNICISSDGETYAASFTQVLSELYTVRGLG
jgi:dipeptidyl aminopeptidase/acylaminoacyl peptidase